MANIDLESPGADRSDLSNAFSAIVGSRVRTVAGTTYTLTDDDHGYFLSFSQTCALTVPAGLRSDFSCGWFQAGSGQITFTATGTTIREPDGFNKSEKQYCCGGLTALASDLYVLYGRTTS